MSGLSSRVMTMKFMQKADMDNEAKLEEENKMKIKDLSEWVLPDSKMIQHRARANAKQIHSIGYASIAELDTELRDSSLTSPIFTGRKKWGEPMTKDQDQEKMVTSTDTSPPDSSSNAGSLDALWKSTQKSKSKKSKKRAAEVDLPQEPDIPIRKKRNVSQATG